MREPQPAARKRHDDLARVEVPGEDQVEGALGNSPHDAREVAEEDAEVGRRVGELTGARFVDRVAARIDSDDLDTASAQLTLGRGVEEDGNAVEPFELVAVDPLRERIPAVGEVVVPEDDDASRELFEQPFEQRQPVPPRDEVAGEEDELRPSLGDPGDRLLGGTPPPSNDAQVEVGEVRDPDAVELFGNAFELHLEHALANPSGLEPAPHERPESGGDESPEDHGDHGSTTPGGNSTLGGPSH